MAFVSVAVEASAAFSCQVYTWTSFWYRSVGGDILLTSAQPNSWRKNNSLSLKEPRLPSYLPTYLSITQVGAKICKTSLEQPERKASKPSRSRMQLFVIRTWPEVRMEQDWKTTQKKIRLNIWSVFGFFFECTLILTTGVYRPALGKLSERRSHHFEGANSFLSPPLLPSVKGGMQSQLHSCHCRYPDGSKELVK